MIHSLAAMGAGFTEAVLVPFERVQCLLQVKQYNTRLHNTKHAFQYLWRYGPSEYYRGLSAILLRNGLSNILFLGLREPLKDSLPTPRTQLGESFNAFISGAGLGAGLSTLFFPLNVVKSRMQTHLGGKICWDERDFRCRICRKKQTMEKDISRSAIELHESVCIVGDYKYHL